MSLGCLDLVFKTSGTLCFFIVSMFLTRKTNFRFLVNLLQFATIDDYDQVALFYQVEISLEWLQLPAYLSREITLGHALNVFQMYII